MTLDDYLSLTKDIADKVSDLHLKLTFEDVFLAHYINTSYKTKRCNILLN